MSVERWIVTTGFAAALCCAALPVSAVVAGREGGPGAASTLMVLNARGGVCTGIVVSPRAVLSAAHCTDGGVDVRIHWKGDDGEPVLIAPAAVSAHPQFDAKAIAARRRSIDLVLLRLPQPLPARFVPAALAEGEGPRAGSPIMLAGYGVSREGEARTTGTYRSAALAAVEPYGPGRILLWASDPGASDPGAKGNATGQGACQGDSGGPMISQDAVVAVTSWSTGAGGKQCGRLSQGVLVSPQRGWIDGVLSSWGEGAKWTIRR